MGQLSFQIDANGFDTLTVEDMGDGCFAFGQRNDRGKVEQVVLSLDMLRAALDAAEVRYGTAKNTDRAETLARARRRLQCANSYRVLDELACISHWPDVGRDDWLTLLGEHWARIDNVGNYLSDMMGLPHFQHWMANPEACHPYVMDEEERRAFAALPDTLTVWRGCYLANMRGMSWSLDRAIAEGFPTRRHYRGEGQAYVAKANVSRSSVLALKLDRGEAEIILAPMVSSELHELKTQAA